MRLLILNILVSAVLLLVARLLPGQVDPMFEMINSNHSNIHFNNKIVDKKDMSILKYSNYYGGAGVAIADFDNDGLQDIYFAGNMVADQLYKNQGGLKFKEMSGFAGIVDNGSWSSGVIVGDVNNDQLPDIYVTCELFDDHPELRKNKLYINKGGFKFEESAAEYGIDDSERTRSATFIDFNKDGFLDLYILNQPPNPGNYSKYSGQALLRKEWSPKLYQNIEGRYFEDVSEKAGISIPCYPNSAVASDINGDGWQDLYIANDYDAPDLLFVNNQDGTFTNIADQALGHMSYYSMGVDIADINNDGLLDIMTLDMVAEDNYRQKANMGGMYPEAFWKLVKNGGHYQYMFNTLQLNYGNEHFGNIAQMSGVSNTDWSWSNIIADFDNDGWKDIYVTNGLLRDIRNTDMTSEFPEYVKSLAQDYLSKNPQASTVPILEIIDFDKALGMHPSVPLQNYSLKNNGDLTFTKSNRNWGLTQNSFSNGCAYGDLDNDGDLEIVVNNINDEAFLFENKTKSHHLRIELIDDKDQETTQGSRIEIFVGHQRQVVELASARGMYSTSEPIVHFGLGNVHLVDSVLIRWPNGQRNLLKDISSNQVLKIYKSKQDQIINNFTKSESEYTVLPGSQFGIDFRHNENVFDDYKRQVLLPHKMSQLGPAMVVGDVNLDGIDDFFVGGATGQEGFLYIQGENGHFEKHTIGDESDVFYEDVDAAFLDYDLDGDLDLYVMSGGNEFPARNKYYLDRLYDNDGEGNFTRNTKSIPRILESGGCVKPYDMDQDGDVDLFLGGRHNPGDYPSPSISRILENRDGKFIDITLDKAEQLVFNGMVTDASWTDYDSDGKTDLLVVGEWMPLTFYRNTENGFKRDDGIKFFKGPKSIMTNGWWNHIQATDIDGDGDMDFICGNLGKNYKYKATQNEPFEVHYDDFDGNGKKDIVLSYYNFGDRFPLRGRSCSAQQIPGISKQFPTFDLFAQAGLTDIYSESALEQSLHLQSFIFEHVILINRDGQNFDVIPLPNELQVSSINEIVEFPILGSKRFIAGGNMYQSEIETPKNDASVGAVFDILDGTIKPIPSEISGMYLPFDIRKMSEITIGQKKSILIVSNDDYLRVVQQTSEK